MTAEVAPPMSSVQCY